MTVYGAAELANAFRVVRKNTVQVAEDIPEDKYDFIAAPGVQSVSQMLRHILASPMLYEELHKANGITEAGAFDFHAAFGRMQAEEAKPLSKAEIVTKLKSDGERFASWLESMPSDFLAERLAGPPGQPSRTRLESLLSPKEHEMHHRAQLMLVERMIGVVPHITRQRQEQAQHRQQQAAAAN
jgi:uncharacterized damage-inducible protein DinB